ncbi:bifunctional diguanylate cyclase/phosphodiesterase [Roseibium sp. CAU 1637]|uniref:Bifunctional diguanylate cyclase/phosphodiesterase n=1 Tax=Roseibium limicola TaxID=2816037 RepID=A0A939ERR1_9HYPH|nr:bifunctional diguanylate cyclase/phosphodiesterase [Roseibium limicola]MBO0346353.1 bifunctional diguanylate cyclase/phosphodiesterase [Roseibium limicola]
MAARKKIHSPITSAALVAAMVVLVAGSFILVMSAIFEFERGAEQRDARSVDRVFDTYQGIILSEIERYSASNTAYQKIEAAFDEDWVAQRFGDDMAGDYTHDAILLLDKANRTSFITSNGKLSAEVLLGELMNDDVIQLIEKVRSRFLAGLLATDESNLAFTGQLSDLSGVVMAQLGDTVGMVAVNAIVPDPGGIPMENKPPHVLVVVHILDELHLAMMGRSLAMDELKVVPAIPDGYVGTPIKDGREETLAYFAWEPIDRASKAILANLPLLLASLSLIAGAILYVLYQNLRAAQDLKLREQQAVYAANHDMLTGFCRRAQFASLADKQLAESGRVQTPVTLAYIDLDLLKEMNDQYGHVVGDKVLECMARKLKTFLRPNDVVGRIGGDEFLVLLEHRGDDQTTQAEIAQISAELNKPIELEGMRLEVGCSLGVSVSDPVNGTSCYDLATLTRRADLALQRCKSEGRRQYRFYDPVMDQVLEERRYIRDGLKRALSNNEFELFYQPIVAASDCRMVFMEALIRWRHPERGLIPPGMFLSVAEQEGMMNEIGDWVLERAISEMSRRPGTGVSVNVCACQLGDENFSHRVEELLTKYNFAHERLILEITESMMMDRSDQIRDLFVGLAESGVAVAIDDFGTGFSSLSSLHEYQFQKLKIDRSFVARIGVDREADSIIRTMIGLAKVLGMRVVAEGVETDEQRKFLVRAQCDYLQGYYFGKPEPFPDEGRQKQVLATSA